MQPKFIHLHVHSDYSMIDGMFKPNDLIQKASEMNFPALALTDFTNFCGLIKFYSSALKSGVKPIIGVDFKVKSDDFETDFYEITALAMNNEGYQNLTQLISKAYLQGYLQNFPVILQKWLKEHSSGVLLLLGQKSDLGQFLLRENQEKTEKSFNFYQKNFSDRFYLELTRVGFLDENKFIHLALELAKNTETPLVATNNVRFFDESNFEAHEIRVAINQGFLLVDPKRPKNYTRAQYFRSEQEMCKLFVDLPDALQNSVEIAKRCNVILRLGEYFLPNFPTGEMDEKSFLVEKAKYGLQKRLNQRFPEENLRKEKQKIYEDRLILELKTINEMEFPGYFLIVMEFIQWAKNNGIPVGPGRGSGAGSLVAYALEITDLDPIEFDLLFERFLNPERVSMPDFDIDFCMQNRDLVIDHVAEIYGRDAVSQIITFGTMAAKAVIRDVGRVLGHPYGFVDRIAKLIPFELGITLDKAFEQEPQIQALYETNEEVKDLFDLARQLEGVIRNAGKHAGGVVISPSKITDFSPIYCDPEGNHPVTQFDKNDVEEAGLIKFDFLGLKTLTVIDWALKMVNEKREKSNLPPILIDQIPLNDKKSFDLLQRAETTAIFQLESRGMKDLIRRLQPDCFEDIIALVALFRPGPLQSGMVDNFIDRKHGREKISYPDRNYQHESLKSILEPTYGIILYQEQVMQIAQVLAGYSLGKADLLRRAMGKKKPEEMAEQRSIFESGAKSLGIDGQLSMKIFDLVEKFAGYGFNKSHSAAYALVSYQTLWLKTHYPAEFMAATMTSDMDNTDKIINLVEECRNLGLTIQFPDINSSEYRFHVNEKGEIIYGLGAVKGVGEAAAEEIIKARNKHGKFKNLHEFCSQINVKQIGKRALEKLIMSGALDKLGLHRAALIKAIPNIIQGSEQHFKIESLGQNDLFGVFKNGEGTNDFVITNVEPYPENIILDLEYESLGFYFSGHPITQYLPELSRYTSGFRLNELSPTDRTKNVTIAGLIISSRIVTSKKGNRIGIITLDDKIGRIDVLLFNEVLENHHALLEKNTILIVTGQVSVDEINGGFRMIARNLFPLDEMREKYARAISISLVESKTDSHLLQQLYEVLKTNYQGSIPVQLYYQKENAIIRLKLGTTWRVNPKEELLIKLKKLLGQNQVELEFD